MPTSLPKSGRSLRPWFQKLLSDCDVELDGGRPWDPQIHDERLFRRVLLRGSLALGEAYVDGLWDCDQLDELFHRILRSGVQRRILSLAGSRAIRARLTNLQSQSRAREVAQRHYDLDNELFATMLGPTGIYSCGYWRKASTLEEAQIAKLRLVCEKLRLKPGMRIVDLGCGWGGAAHFAAEQYGVEVVGVTNSVEQARQAREFCRGLPVEIRLQDYRELEGVFDRAFSLGMFEHVGVKNQRRFLSIVRNHLDPEGLLLLHTIGSLRSSATGDPWIQRYIFPNSVLPSAARICGVVEGLFVVEDWHNFGADYDATLVAWHHNFEEGWDQLQERYDRRFHRLWRYYLLSCAGSFRARYNQLWQIALSPRGIPGGYRAPR